MVSFRISIIIPVFNEEDTIANLLHYLNEHSKSQTVADIIVVDGESTDNTEAKVKEHNVMFLKSKKGRAKQMNLGAKHAKGVILYFLHADSLPPKHFDELIINEVQKGNLAGCFKMKFDSNHWWLYLAGWFTQFNWRICRGGDQSQFITKSLFEEIGGFDEEFIVFEDNDLINKLYSIKQFTVVQKWITTSSRRYHKNGIWKLQYHFWVIHIKKWFGASAEDLLNYYKKYIV